MEARTESEPSAAPDLQFELGKFLREHWPSAAAKAKAAAAGAGAIAALNAKASAATPTSSGGDFNPLLVRLVNRVCGGFVHSEYQLALQLGGFAPYRNYHLNYQAIPDPAVTSAMPQLYVGNELLTSTPRQMWQTGVGTAPFRISFKALTATRAVLTKRMLFERMAEFWTDHLNVFLQTSENMAYLKPYEDQRVIRADALGTFRRMLAGDDGPDGGSAKSPAMLLYLDNYLNSCVAGEASNENYGRELLELHTLGVNAGYTEDDVKAASACFTGWTTPEFANDPNFGTFVYDGNAHCGGPETVFGIPIPAGGKIQGEILLNALVAQSATKQFISRKLISWLLRYDVDAGPTEVAAAAYGNTGDVKEMVKAILTPAAIEKVEADQAYKVKRPYGYAVNLLRSLPHILDLTGGSTIVPGTTSGSALPLAALTEFELAELNNAPYMWAPPNGYPDSFSAWTSNLVATAALPFKILTHQVPGIYFLESDLTNWVLSLGPLGPGGFGQRMNQLLTGGCMPSLEAQLVDAFFVYGAQQGWKLNDILRGGAAVAACTPTYLTY